MVFILFFLNLINHETKTGRPKSSLSW